MNQTITYSIVAVIIGCGLVAAAMQHNAQPKQIVTESDTVSAVGSVSPEQFEELAKTGEYTVIDIRTPEEIAEGKVFADALELNYYAPNFKTALAQLDREQPYLIYCRSGNRSGGTLKIMQSLGFTKVRDLKGGKVAWEKSGRTLKEPSEAVKLACPTDVKICPDGSSVGREGEECDFAPCPSV